MKKIITYKTDDGQTFTKKEDAIKHQLELDNIDYKAEYYKLLTEISNLKFEISLLKKYDNPFGYPITRINGGKSTIGDYLDQLKFGSMLTNK